MALGNFASKPGRGRAEVDSMDRVDGVLAVGFFWERVVRIRGQIPLTLTLSRKWARGSDCGTGLGGCTRAEVGGMDEVDRVDGTRDGIGGGETTEILRQAQDDSVLGASVLGRVVRIPRV